MWDVLSLPTVQAVLGLVVLCILIAGGFWLVASFRDHAADDRLDPKDVLANFEEMHREGDISGTEFRTIKASMTRSRGVVSSDDDQSV
jgi:uncharacterized membrane protein